MQFVFNRECSVTREVECPGLWTCEQPIVLLCSRVTLLYFFQSPPPSFCIRIFLYSLIRLCTCIFLFFCTLAGSDGRWSMTGGRGVSGAVAAHSPLATPFSFLIWGGGVVHWCWWTCTCTRGGGQVQPCAVSPNTHTGRVAVKRVNQILKLPLSPPDKREGKRRFSPWVTFLHPTFIIQALSSLQRK